MGGTTGQLKISERASTHESVTNPEVLAFLGNPLAVLRELQGEVLSVKDLLMLALGCIPLGQGRFYTLIEVVPVRGAAGEDGEDEGPGRPDATRSLTFASTYFEDSDNDELATTSKQRAKSMLKRRNTMIATTKKPIPLRLEKVDDVDDKVHHLLRAFGGIQGDIIMSLESTKVDSAVSSLLNEYMNMTYVPPAAEWVRVFKSHSLKDEDVQTFFIWRAHAQEMACGLLSLSWHPENYLIGGDSNGVSMHLLLSAKVQFPYLLTRIKENVSKLNMTEAQKRDLAEKLARADRHVRNGAETFSRSSYRTLYELDTSLLRIAHKTKEVNDMVGVLMITNEEFASLVRQSARYYDKMNTGMVEIDLSAGMVKVPLPFGGGTQDFPVDLGSLYDNWAPTKVQVSLQVNYEIIIMNCLRASLRSFMLSSRFKGSHLIRAIARMEDVSGCMRRLRNCP